MPNDNYCAFEDWINPILVRNGDASKADEMTLRWWLRVQTTPGPALAHSPVFAASGRHA